jgi:predicted nuclease of predicted toxin-antitoxin system
MTCGNVANRNLRQLFTAILSAALEQIKQGEAIVEIGNK